MAACSIGAFTKLTHLDYSQASYVGDFLIILAIRYVLDTENKRRDALQASSAHDEYGYVEKADSDGQIIRQKVDKAMLDLTDRQNLSFRYAL